MHGRSCHVDMRRIRRVLILPDRCILIPKLYDCPADGGGIGNTQ